MKYKPRKGSFKSHGRVLNYDMRCGGIACRMRDGGPFPTDWFRSMPEFLSEQNDLFWARYESVWCKERAA